MKEDAPRVIKIPAKPEATRQAEARRQLRVAAYCRVSTKEEDQANSYEVQKEYYITSSPWAEQKAMIRRTAFWNRVLRILSESS